MMALYGIEAHVKRNPIIMFTREIKKVAIVGTGVIGAGWAARFLYRGVDVVATDPGEDAEEFINEVVENSRQAQEKLLYIPPEKRGRLHFTKNLNEAVKDADYIQESAPEVADIKIPLLSEISKYAPPTSIIGSSTSGLLPTKLQSEILYPERFVVAHPFNPVYLLPLVEVVGGKKTSPDAIDTAMKIYKTFGMKPLKVRVEIEGHISDRLLEAVWREILWMVNDNLATTEELDDAIIYGPGLRWALMGTNLTYLLAGGKRGMRHFMEQFGPALKLPWCHLEAPELTNELIDKLVEQTAVQAKNRDLRELELLRDNCLVAIMQALSEYEHAAGKVIKEDMKTQKYRDLL
jgi:carnitine 3-dehydrogenase